MKRILVPTKSVEDWKWLLAKPYHWAAGKSAMSIALSWEKNPDRLPTEIATLLDATGDSHLHGLKMLVAIPEYQVELPGGQRPSQTDVLAIARNEQGLVVLAVEGKVEEPFGPILAEKRAEASSGQEERLDFLHKVLGLDKPLPDTIRYQLLHRTASAILVAREFHAATAVMLVHSFSPDGQWFDDFAAFSHELGALVRKDSIVMVPTLSNPALYLGWSTGAVPSPITIVQES